MAAKKKPALIAELERQAANGDVDAVSRLGDHYRTGDALTQDLTAAFEWYTRGAALGDADSQNNLGTMYLRGCGCEQDKAEAIRWYRKSAEQGNAVAQWNLAKRYFHGDGTRQDYKAAYEWFSRAAAQGYSDAVCEMGTMHWLGQGVERNLLAAADFHLTAAETGDELAARNLREYRAELEEIALSGSQMASLFLCRMYNRGFGADRSQPMTWAWILWAHKHCRPDPHSEIAEEVVEAHRFYLMCVSSENRRAGDKLVAGWRRAAKAGAVRTGR